jgi:ABC transporter substrate binding protein (PQQ-dependent alcohol dehydrogenase system)
MIARLAVLAVLITALIAGSLAPARAAEKQVFDFAYLYREGDPAYERTRAYTGLRLRDRSRPLDGARLARKESGILGRALGLEFGLREEALAGAQTPLARIEALMAEGVRVFLLDLGVDEVAALGRALKDREVLLFNPRHGADSLRGEACSPVLFHTLPSDAMLMDGLAQFLVKRNWREVLMLVGEREADKTLARAFEAAARKFGLEISDSRDFILSNDPRERDQNNLAILTGGVDYDVVFLADALGEVGRFLPYQTQDPRPVVGGEGLLAGAWHWTWERHGAPQLNQRFDKLAGRRMTGEDWAAWAAVKVVVEAIARTESTAIPALYAYLRGDRLTFDSYKGVPGSFRPWDNQLRQAVLLHTHNAVIARAPLEGFLHERNSLDSLGRDEAESACRFP